MHKLTLFIFSLLVLPTKMLAQESSLGSSPYIISIHCDGGWDPTLVFDNKLTSSMVDSHSGSFSGVGAGNIPYVRHSSRPSVDEYFKNYGDRSLIINGLSTRTMSHLIGTIDSLSFKNSLALSQQVGWLTFYSSQIAGALQVPHVNINAPYFPGDFVQFASKLIPQYLKNHPDYDDTIIKPTETSHKALMSFLNDKYVKILDSNLLGSIDEKKIQSFYYNSVNSNFLYKAYENFKFDETENQLVNDGYLAIDLIRKGYSQTVSLQAGKAKSWDTHQNNFQQQSELFESLFSSINKILEKAKLEGILNNLTIIVSSDIGRSPKLNANSGKDHWPYTSMLLYGQGIKGGSTFGSTNDFLIGQMINPTFGTKIGFDDTVIDTRHIMTALLQYYGVPQTMTIPDILPAFAILKAE